MEVLTQWSERPNQKFDVVDDPYDPLRERQKLAARTQAGALDLKTYGLHWSRLVDHHGTQWLCVSDDSGAIVSGMIAEAG